MITYPSFWKGGSPDIERCLKDLFTVPENAPAGGLSGSDLLSGVDIRSWLPTPSVAADWFAQGNGYLRVYRTGGQMTRQQNGWVDQARVQLAAWCANRDQSWELIEYVREMLAMYEDGGTVHRSSPSPTGLRTTRIRVQLPELTGPQLIPEQILDDKLVPVTFEIHTDRPKSLPDYRELLQLV